MRYNLLLASLLVFAASACYTFASQIRHYSENVRVATSYQSSVTSTASYTPLYEKPAQNSIDTIITFFNSHASTIVVFWFIIICFKCVQLLTGLSVTSRLKNQQIFPAGDYWEERLKTLSAQLTINQYVKLAQSGLAKVPLTIGYFKPVILFPLGMLAAMPHDQVEAILLHELAHIRRKDYLVNIIQCLVEILFFFNPAIWWLSSLLRAERENCCDDLAVSKTNSRTNYIKALIAFEEYQEINPQYASAVTGSRNHLLNRAKRLIYNHNKTLNPMEKIILTCGLVVTGMLTVAFTQVEKDVSYTKVKTSISKAITAPLISSKRSQTNIAVLDTVKKSTQKSSISTTVDGKSYKLVRVDGKITEFYIDNARVPDDKIADYKDVTDKLIADSDRSRALAAESRLKAELVRKEAQKNREIAMKKAMDDRREANIARVKETAARSKLMIERSKDRSEQARMAAKQAIDVNRQTPVTVQTEKMSELVETLRTQSEALKKEAEARKLSTEDSKNMHDLIQQIEQIKIQAEKIKEESQKIKRDVDQNRKSSRIKYEPKGGAMYASQSIDARPRQRLFETGQKVRLTEPVSLITAPNINTNISYQSPKNSLGQKIYKELIKEGIAKEDHVLFHMTNDELTVDGVKQSDEVFKRIVKAISKDSSDNIDITYSNNR